MKTDCTLRTDNLRKTLFSLVFTCGAAFAGTRLCAQAYSNPITITTGGSYSGNWQSNDSNTPAVTISTNSPVTITNSSIKGPGDLIRVADGIDAAQVTVLNTYGYGTYPTQAGTEKGCFLFVRRPASVDVEHCYMEGTGLGLLTSGYGGSPNAVNPIKFLYNRGLNMDGRYIDGHGSYMTGQNYGIGPGYDRYFSHFVQISGASDLSGYGIPGADIGWNEIVNLPGQSSVDDNFSLYQASGTPTHRILFHDNYVQGGYGSTPTVENNGSAFQMDSNGNSPDESTPALSTAYAHIFSNSVVNCVGGVEASTGHDVEIDHNRVFFSAQLPDGTPLNSLYSLGLGIQDYLSKDYRSSTVGGTPTNFAHDNYVGSYMYKQPYPPVRFDYSFATDAVDPARNVVNDSTDHVLPWNANLESNGPDSQQACLAAERAEYGMTWLPKLAQNGVTIGPTNNLVVNPGFEIHGISGWTSLSSSGGGLQDISYLFDGGIPHGGNDCLLHHGGGAAWQEQTGQEIHGLSNGSYTLSAWCRRSAPQVRCRIGVRKFGGKKQLTSPLVAPPLTGSSDWAQYSVSFAVTNASTASAQDGSVEIFFLSGGNPGQFSAADDFVLRSAPLAVITPPTVPNKRNAASGTKRSASETGTTALAQG